MSAERKLETEHESAAAAGAAAEPFALRDQVAERLAAHRSRRPRSSEPVQSQPTSHRARASKIASAVAERYAQTKSYHAYLAEEAERAVREAEEAARQAQAAAEIAARNAEAMAQVQYDLLTELDEYGEAGPSPVVSKPQIPAVGQRSVAQQETAEELAFDFEPSAAPAEPPVFTVRHMESLRRPAADADAAIAWRSHNEPQAEETVDPSEFDFLDEEIAFRQDPSFEPVEPPVEIPGNLIQFPRQLVAPRKARPRLAEGPLLDEAVQHSDPSQLRIFEVEAEQISAEPALEESAPEWTSILLDAHPRQQAAAYDVQARHLGAAYAEPSYAPVSNPYGAQHLQLSPETEHLYSTPIEVAPIGLRLMSAMVDLCIVLAAFLVFAAVAMTTATHFIGAVQMAAPTAAISSGGSIVLLGLLYHLLFFTFSDATPGMRYARIGLCTFSDENPSRAAMRRRLFALALSSASLGLGVLWALLDDERLGWHDRISRMYQRSY